MISGYTDLNARLNQPFKFLKNYYDDAYSLCWLNSTTWKSGEIRNSDTDNKILNIAYLLQFQRHQWNDQARTKAVDVIRSAARDKVN